MGTTAGIGRGVGVASERIVGGVVVGAALVLALAALVALALPVALLLALMPFALLVLGGDTAYDIPFAGEVLAALAFLMTGLGLHMTQTAGLALASDRATDETRPRVVALLYVMFLVGMGVSALIFGAFLSDFSNLGLVRVVQGAAVAGLLLNLVALWRQESVRPMSRAERAAPGPRFAEAWADFAAGGRAGRQAGCQSSFRQRLAPPPAAAGRW